MRGCCLRNATNNCVEYDPGERVPCSQAVSVCIDTVNPRSFITSRAPRRESLFRFRQASKRFMTGGRPSFTAPGIPTLMPADKPQSQGGQNTGTLAKAIFLSPVASKTRPGHSGTAGNGKARSLERARDQKPVATDSPRSAVAV
jgi:hypothetical protein